MIEVTKENFKSEVMNSKEIVVIDYYADWCSKCRALMPYIDRFSDNYPNIKFVKINAALQPELSSSESGINNFTAIRGLPHIKFIKNNSEFNCLFNGVTPQKIEDILNSLED